MPLIISLALHLYLNHRQQVDEDEANDYVKNGRVEKPSDAVASFIDSHPGGAVVRTHGRRIRGNCLRIIVTPRA